jgi:hypothetical protein
MYIMRPKYNKAALSEAKRQHAKVGEEQKEEGSEKGSCSRAKSDISQNKQWGAM